MICSLQAQLLRGARFAALIAAVLIVLGAASGPTVAAPAQLIFSYSAEAADFLPLWIADDAGYFKKQGLDVSVRSLPAEEGVVALLSDQVQIAGVGGSDGISAIAQGAKLNLIGAITPIYNFQFWALPKYATRAALKGQRVGVVSSTGSIYAATLLALKQLGLTASDVAITPLGSVTNVNNSLLAGSVVAAASHAPVTYQFKRAGLVDLVDLAEKKIPSVSAGIWVLASYAQAHHETVQKAVDALSEGVQRERSDRAFAENEIRKHLGVKDKAELDFTYDFYTKEVLAPQLTPEPAEVESNIKELSATNPKVESVDVKAIIDPSFAEAAARLQARNGD